MPFALTRAALLAVALLAAATIPDGVACRPCELSSIPLVDALGRWDGGAYLSIAREGYSFEAGPGEMPTAAFSPLLPVLMRALATPAGASDDALLAAGALVANVALLVGLLYLIELGRTELDPAAARRAALYLLVFPTTVFLSAVYPESLFLALAAASLVEARRGRWWSAGAAAALGALARPFGVLLLVPLAVERAVQHRSGRRIGPEVIALAGPPLAFAAWQAYLYQASGDPLLFLSAQDAYRRRVAPPWEALAGLFDPAQYGQPWIVLGTFLLIVTLVVMSWRVLRPSTATCATVMLLATASSATLTSFPRYALAVFPVFLVLGALGRHRAIHLGYLGVATVLAMTLTAMFAAWYWIG